MVHSVTLVWLRVGSKSLKHVVCRLQQWKSRTAALFVFVWIHDKTPIYGQNLWACYQYNFLLDVIWLAGPVLSAVRGLMKNCKQNLFSNLKLFVCITCALLGGKLHQVFVVWLLGGVAKWFLATFHGAAAFSHYSAELFGWFKVLCVSFSWSAGTNAVCQRPAGRHQATGTLPPLQTFQGETRPPSSVQECNMDVLFL